MATFIGLMMNSKCQQTLYWFCHFFNFEQLNKTVTIPSLTKTDLLNIKIPLPPFEKQLCFSNICDKTRILKARMLQGDLNLFKSLQNKVFSENL